MCPREIISILECIIARDLSVDFSIKKEQWDQGSTENYYDACITMDLGIFIGSDS